MVFYKYWRFWPFGEVILKHSVHCHGRLLAGLAFVFSSKTSTNELFVAMEFLYSLITLSLVSFDVVFQIISVPTLQFAPVYKWRTLHSVHRSSVQPCCCFYTGLLQYKRDGWIWTVISMKLVTKLTIREKKISCSSGNSLDWLLEEIQNTGLQKILSIQSPPADNHYYELLWDWNFFCHIFYLCMSYDSINKQQLFP